MSYYFNGRCAGTAFSDFDAREGMYPAIMLGETLDLEPFIPLQ